MPDYSEQIKELEAELAKTPYNKRTQHHVGLVKAKIAKLKESQEKRSGGGKKGEGYTVRKAGDASVILVGFPSVGKSTLLNTITGAESETAAYAFTTLTCIPGMLNYKGAQMQILDVPGVVAGAASGKGRGKEVLSVMRNADLVLIVVDVFSPQHYPILKKEVYDTNVRLNQKKPDVKIKKTTKGGIDIGSTVKLTKVDKRTLTDVLREFKINNAQVVLRSNIDIDEFIDVIEKNKVYIPAAIVVTKKDLADEAQLKKVKKEIKPDIFISCHEKENIEELKELIFQKLTFMRVFCKEVGKPADMKEPLILRQGATVRTMCEKLHKDFVKKFKFVRIWGSSRFPGQEFRRLSYELKDGDVVEIHLK